jgi:hypothetical protein
LFRGDFSLDGFDCKARVRYCPMNNNQLVDEHLGKRK